MKYSRIYALALVAAIFGGSMCLNAATSAGEVEEPSGSEKAEQKGKKMKKGKRPVKSRKGKKAKSGITKRKDEKYFHFLVDKEGLRSEIVDAIEKVDELMKFKRSIFPQDKSKFKDEKFREKFNKKVQDKMKTLDLSLEAIDKLRALPNLTADERFVINRIDNKILHIILKKMDKWHHGRGTLNKVKCYSKCPMTGEEKLAKMEPEEE